MKLKTAADKFDSLFALTYLLNSEDYWLHDNECYEKRGALEAAIKLLGNLCCQDVESCTNYCIVYSILLSAVIILATLQFTTAHYTLYRPVMEEVVSPLQRRAEHRC